MAEPVYDEKSIKSLDWREHIRLRPGMYIGNVSGKGNSADEGLYVLIKEVADNCLDEYMMGYGKRIEITVKNDLVTVRDYGRGIPLGKVVECVSKINTGGKYDSEAFQKSIGLNGVGTKAVNALSATFKVESFRDGKTVAAEFVQGNLVSEDKKPRSSDEKSGTLVTFFPDKEIFGEFTFRKEFIEKLLWNYAYLNTGLTLVFNGERYNSKNGLFDLLTENLEAEANYPIIHFKEEDIEIAFTHTSQYGEDYFSFVNGQYTTLGGTHEAAFKQALVDTIRGFFKKDYHVSDVRSGLVGAIAIRVQEPTFESQTKVKLGSDNFGPDGPSIRLGITNFLKKELDNYLHKNPSAAEAIKKRILQSERERTELKGIQKIAKDRAKKAKVVNKKLRDCKVHFNSNHKDAGNSSVFITEGDSASGSITKSRDPMTQAVFSLRGKPLNTYGMKRRVIYENEEFYLLQNALDIEDGLENLRYNKIILATDADVDGFHIRLLLMCYFLQFFPEMVRRGHLYILQTPLFRVRNKKATVYCYSEDEKRQAMATLSGKVEITRFKGLGEISPSEFKQFISENIRLEPVLIGKNSHLKEMLEFYMGKNTPERKDFIVDNLVIEAPINESVEEEAISA
ncbi:MAG: DNA topoisomerase IV subunit B [Verrucomicrobia bacterium]|nr:DNA topoisomerase IV subunit B [Verrucomicrobiota bacterium]MDA1065353.1 DNA topoisomerase IV subunit B [Verrucomicrobiota bacterium]